MTHISLLLAAASLAVLVLGAWTLRLTANRGVLLNTMFASGALLYAAYQAAVRTQPEWALVLPFFATMLLAGCALGTWWRSRREDELREPVGILAGAASVCLTALLCAWFAL